MFGAVEKTTAARSFLETTFAGEVQAALRLLYVPVSAAAVVLTQKVIWIRADGSKEATLRLSAHFLCLDLDAEVFLSFLAELTPLRLLFSPAGHFLQYDRYKLF